jgi:hypothetical protein
LTEKGTYSAPSILSSELDSFKCGHSENLCNHGGLDVIETSRVLCEHVENLEHFSAVASSAKLSDCSLNSHEKKKKSV